jgi:hypothetical protein
MIVGLLTIEQKEQLVGEYFADDQRFNPVQDGEGNWIISTEEMYECINPDFMWVRELPLIDWIPVII